MTADETSKTIAYHICPLCEAGCGLEVHLVDGDVSLIRGDRDDVFSNGFLCPKGTALKGLQDDPDRLLKPLIKRNGRFVEVEFDEAFAEVARLLTPLRAEHGAAACGIAIGNPTVHRTGLLLYVRDLIAAVGTPNVFSAATLDQMPKHLSVGEMFGDFYSMPVPDIERSDLLVIIGANPVVSNGSLWSVPNFRGRAAVMRERGGRIITIDPRFTETAKLADQHHNIQPGTDALLLAAIVHVLFDEGLVEFGRLEPHVKGVRALQSAVVGFQPDHVAGSCGVAADVIRSIARELAAAPTAAVYGRLGTCLAEHATVTSWLVDAINTITGNLDKPGGAMFPKAPAFAGNTTGLPGSGSGVETGTYRSRVSGAPEIMGQFPMGCLAEEIETPGEGQLRALITIASNVALSAADGPRIEKALDQLDVLISLDIYLNETTRHADVIIPGPSALEEAHYDVFFSQFAHRNTARFSPPSLPKPASTPTDWETILRLVAILAGDGVDSDIEQLDEVLTRALLEESAAEHAEAIMAVLQGQTGLERRLDMALRAGPYGDLFGLYPDGLTLAKIRAKPSGIDLGQLEARIPEMLRTPSGKIELAPERFISALGDVERSIGEPVPDCVLVGRRHLRSNNSWMHNIRVLAKGKNRFTMLVNPDDADRWLLTDRGEAVVESVDTGATIEVVVEFDDAMMPGVVSLPHGWGHDGEGTRMAVAERRPGVNINVLTNPNRRDALSGNAALNGVAVTVKAMQGA